MKYGEGAHSAEMRSCTSYVIPLLKDRLGRDETGVIIIRAGYLQLSMWKVYIISGTCLNRVRIPEIVRITPECEN